MPLTPVEIRHVELRRDWFRGYRRGTVERLLTDIADSFEDVWRERADLADQVEELQAEASKHRELEALLRSTLVSAERSAQDTREQARRESDLIVQEAHAEGRRVTRATARPRNNVSRRTSVKIRAQLRARARGTRRVARGCERSRLLRRSRPRSTTRPRAGFVESWASEHVRARRYPSGRGGPEDSAAPARRSRGGPVVCRRPAWRGLEAPGRQRARAR